MSNSAEAGTDLEDAGPLLLIDGHALVFRAFYALQNERPLTNARGELTSGVFGFTSMLLKAVGELKPKYLIATFDAGGPTFRTAEFQAYKGTRKAAPEGLREQVQKSYTVLEAMQVPIYRLERFEADDLIGTLTRQAEAAGIPVIILSGDNDLLQLVGPGVKVMTSRRGISDTVMYDEEGVAEKYGGLRPDQVVDFKALRGDVTDNIPGVPGIGDKTAQKLLLEFGTLERLYEQLDRVPEKQRALLDAHRDQVLLAKRLATIECAAPVTLDLEQARLAELHRPEVLEVFHDLSFKSLIDRLPRPTAAETTRGEGQPATAQLGLFGDQLISAGTERLPPARVVADLTELEAVVAELRARTSFAFNVQATGTLPMSSDVVGLGFAAGDDLAAYVPVGHALGSLPLKSVLERVAPLFVDAAVAKRAHNAKFHLMLLERSGVRVAGLSFDTMIAAYLLESGQRALALRDLAWGKLQVELPSVQSLLGTGKKAITMAQLGAAECGAYACQEAALVERLAPLLERELEDAGQTALFREIELPLVPVLAQMELAGIKVDLPSLEALGVELGQRLVELEREIFASVGHEFTIASPSQLSNVLFQELKLETKARRQKTKTGHISTGVEVLEELRGTHPSIDLILEHRQLSKLKGTYVDALLGLVHPDTHRVHTSFNQTVAATGRLSSSDPNLQNIPIRTDVGRRVRRCFVAEEGMCLLSADYSQIELRILAHMANDPTLLEAFARGEDPHAVTAAEVLGIPIEKVTSDDRRVAKMVNYGVLYGMSDFGLAERLGLPTADANAFISRYFDRFNTVKEFQDRVIRDTTRLGYSETLLGRRRYIPEIRSPIYGIRQAGIRAAINAPIQGSASDVVKKAMIPVHQLLEEQAPGVRMLLQVHDELVFEGPEGELRWLMPRLADLMSGAYVLHAPLHVDFKLGKTWEDMQPVSEEAVGASA